MPVFYISWKTIIILVFSALSCNRERSDHLCTIRHHLTKYETARILGQRAKQLNSGAKTFVKVPPNVLDGYEIAKLELEEKKIPFIIKRPIPDGTCEYWNVSDLEVI